MNGILDWKLSRTFLKQVSPHKVCSNFQQFSSLKVPVSHSIFLWEFIRGGWNNIFSMPAYPFFALQCRLPTVFLLTQGSRKVSEASSKCFGMEGGVRSPPPALASSSLVILSAENTRKLRAVNSLPSLHPPRFVVTNVLFVTCSVRYKNFMNSRYRKPFTAVCSLVPKLYALLKCINRDITALTPGSVKVSVELK